MSSARWSLIYGFPEFYDDTSFLRCVRLDRRDTGSYLQNRKKLVKSFLGVW